MSIQTLYDMRALTLLFILISIQIQAQSHLPRIPNTKEDSILIAIDVKNHYLASLQLENEKEARKFDWLGYIPTPGYTRQFGLEMRYNFIQIYSVLRDRQSRKLKRKELFKLAQEDTQIEIEQYRLLKQERDNFYEGLQIRIANLELEERLYEIDKEKYSNNEISISELIQKEINYRQKLVAYRELDLRLKEYDRKLFFYENLTNRYQSDVQ